MEWFDCSIPLHPPGGLDARDFDAMEDMFFIQTEDELFTEDWLTCYATEILDTKYEWTDVKDVVDMLAHLNAQQKADFLRVLQENSKMFDGTLGIYPHQKVHIELLPGAKPMHSQPYPVPRMHLATFKRELDHLIKIRVLVPTQYVLHLASSSRKRMAVCTGSVIYASSTKSSNANNILYQSYQINYKSIQGTSFLRNLTSACRTIPLNLMKKVKISV